MWLFPIPYTSSSEPEKPLPPPKDLVPSLPDDITVKCLARLPISQHPTLSLVSKPFRSLISSPLLFNARSLNRCTQHLLYITLRTHSESSSFQWFSLHANPFLLRPLPALPVPTIGAAYVVLGHTLYVIGGSVNDIPCPNVWILDCRFNKWFLGAPLRVSREFAAAEIVDGKIYVLGGCAPDTWARCAFWCEVFDPELNKWDRVPSPANMRAKWMHASAALDNKVYAMADRGGVAYDPRRGAWGRVGYAMDIGWRGRACVVDGILYCYDFVGHIKGFDENTGEWMELKGVNKSLPKFLCGATMADAGGKLIVVWEGLEKGKEMDIWCAEIQVNKNNPAGELWGEVNWLHKVLSAPKGSSIVNCSAVAL